MIKSARWLKMEREFPNFNSSEIREFMVESCRKDLEELKEAGADFSKLTDKHIETLVCKHGFNSINLLQEVGANIPNPYTLYVTCIPVLGLLYKYGLEYGVNSIKLLLEAETGFMAITPEDAGKAMDDQGSPYDHIEL